MLQRNEQRLTLNFGFVGCGGFQVENNAGSLTSLDHVGRSQITKVEIHSGPTHGIPNSREVERDSGRRLNAETGRNSREGFRQIDADNLRTTLNGTRYRLNRVLRVYQRYKESRAQRHTGNHASKQTPERAVHRP